MYVDYTETTYMYHMYNIYYIPSIIYTYNHAHVS